jgi:glycosyltransferase involved in cell wall biosynthesis
VGGRDYYKNWEAFIRAIAPLLQKYDIHLICTGGYFNKKTEVPILEELNMTGRIIWKYFSDDELVEAYAKAICFVFPSLYEGFGIPVLEAFAAGCPVALSRASCLPEVGGDAVVYFDPESMEDMRSAVDQLITSPSLQNQLIAAGKERVKQFSWERCARETAAVYSRL